MGRKPGNSLPPNPGADERVKLNGWTIYGRELAVIAQVMRRYHLPEASAALRIIINDYDAMRIRLEQHEQNPSTPE